MALVTLRSYRDPIDAELTKARLESAGIDAVIADRYLASIQWLYSAAIGGVKVMVDETDLADARAVLAEDRSADLASVPEARSFPIVGDFCPACGSREVSPSPVRRRAAAVSLLTGLPFVAWRRRWVCRACAHSWKRRSTAAAELPEETVEADRRVQERHSYYGLWWLLYALAVLGLLYYLEIRNRGG